MRKKFFGILAGVVCVSLNLQARVEKVSIQYEDGTWDTFEQIDTLKDLSLQQGQLIRLLTFTNITDECKNILSIFLEKNADLLKNIFSMQIDNGHKNPGDEDPVVYNFVGFLIERKIVFEVSYYKGALFSLGAVFSLPENKTQTLYEYLGSFTTESSSQLGKTLSFERELDGET